MFHFLKSIFRDRPKTNIGELIANGARIIDVRTSAEYQAGHLKNSINIPLEKLAGNLHKFEKSKIFITCCASGARSATAKNILKANGYTEAYNGGSWTSLRKYF